MLQALIDVTIELAPWLLLGTVIAALMHGMLPAGFVRRHLGGARRGSGRTGGLGAVTKAVAVGVPLPLCSCGVIPAGLGLRRDGASRGASVGFLISTPQTGVDSVLVSASMLGWPFALFKVAAAGVLGVLGGWLTDATDNGTEEEAAADPATRATTADPSDVRPGAREMWLHGVDVLRSIWKWLVFGVVTSAAISTWVPQDTFAGLTTGGELLMLGGVLLVSVPLYVCATASVPIAAALVGAGMPVGGALVFLMAGPATNVATIGSVHRALGTRALVVYLSVIVLGSVAAAAGYEAIVSAVFGPESAGLAAGLGASAHAAHDAHGAHGGHGGPVALGSAVVLAGLIVFFAFEELRGLVAPMLAGRRANDDAAPAPTHVHMAVEGMTCGGCANKLRRALLAGEGVVSAEVAHDPGHIDVDVVAPSAAAAQTRLAQIVRETGYAPVGV